MNNTDSEEEEEIWSMDSSSDFEDFDCETPPSMSTRATTESQSVPRSLCTWIVLFLSHFQVIFYIPDRAMDMLLKFMSAFFIVLGTFCSVCYQIANVLPRSVYRLKTYLGVNNLSAIKYVVCRKCDSIYHYKDCVSGYSSKTCSYIKFPNHRYHRYRQQCGTLLLKSVEVSTGRKILYPFITYCYLGLQWAIQQFLFEP